MPPPPRHRNPNLWRLGCLCTALLATCAAAAGVDPGVLDRLGDASSEVREAASSEILSDTTLDPETLVAVLPAAGERPEVRARLLAAMRHHFLRRMREASPGAAGGAEGAGGGEEAGGGLLERAGRAALAGPDATKGSMGVSHRAFPPGAIPGVEAASVAVLKPLPGFPAYAVLRPGDLIVSLNGRPVAWPEREPADPNAGNRLRPAQPRERVRAGVNAAGSAFVEAVQTAGAGTTVTLGVVRGAERIEVPVTLVPAETLRRLYPGGNVVAAESAWADRLAELLAERDPRASP